MNTTDQTFHTPNVVQQRRREDAAINAVMNPAPAGKLTDEQLGEIGAKAAKQHVNSNLMANHRPARTAFARAVREAVEKEQAEEHRLTPDQNSRMFAVECQNTAYKTESAKQAEEIARLTAELAELVSKYSDMCTRLQECVQTHKLGLGGEKIDKLVVEAVANLTAENIALSAGFLTLKADQKGLSQSIVSEQIKKHEALVGLAKANAELERLRQSLAALPDRWRKDKESAQSIMTVNGCAYELEKALKPAPTAEEVEFEKAYHAEYPNHIAEAFEKFKDGRYLQTFMQATFDGWKLARAAKEAAQ